MMKNIVKKSFVIVVMIIVCIMTGCGTETKAEQMTVEKTFETGKHTILLSAEVNWFYGTGDFFDIPVIGTSQIQIPDGYEIVSYSCSRGSDYLLYRNTVPVVCTGTVDKNGVEHYTEFGTPVEQD